MITTEVNSGSSNAAVPSGTTNVTQTLNAISRTINKDYEAMNPFASLDTDYRPMQPPGYADNSYSDPSPEEKLDNARI